MGYPFVQARWFSPGKREAVRAIVVHFAEGGNTVHYFTNPTRAGRPVDVSATFVIEESGRIVQMVRDDDVDHCQHASRGSWSYPGGLSDDVGREVLGAAVVDAADNTLVNRYVQAVELVGFRADGMTAAQEEALVALVNERRAKYGAELRGVIGHGDVQDKPCPGALIPWERLGGHGLFTQEDPVQFAFKVERWKVNATAEVTTVGTPLKADGTPDFSQRLALTANADGSNRQLRPLARSALTPVSGELDDAFYAALIDYELPAAADCAAQVADAVNAALDHVSSAVDGVDTALAEARIR